MNGSDFLNLLCGSSTITGLLDNNPNDTGFRATVLQWLNLVQKDISNRQQSFHWRFLEKTGTFNTVASDFDYALGTIAADIDTTKFVSVYDKTNDWVYTFIPYDRFRRYIADETNSTGNSRFFSVFADQLLLYPVPSGVVATYIDYIKIITALTDAATAGDIPSKYDSVVIDGVLTYGYKFDPDLGDWRSQQAQYEAGIQRMIQDNGQNISEISRSESHRTGRSLVDGKNSIYFPLADF